ncbi:hypothetical protein ABK040_011654 [Willaertia magna]
MPNNHLLKLLSIKRRMLFPISHSNTLQPLEISQINKIFYEKIPNIISFNIFKKNVIVNNEEDIYLVKEKIIKHSNTYKQMIENENFYFNYFKKQINNYCNEHLFIMEDISLSREFLSHLQFIMKDKILQKHLQQFNDFKKIDFTKSTQQLNFILKEDTLDFTKCNIELLMGPSGIGKTFKMFTRSSFYNFYLLYFTKNDLKYLLKKRLTNLNIIQLSVLYESELQLLMLFKLNILKYFLENFKNTTLQNFIHFQLFCDTFSYNELHDIFYNEVFQYLNLFKQTNNIHNQQSLLSYHQESLHNLNKQLIKEIEKITKKRIGISLDNVEIFENYFSLSNSQFSFCNSLVKIFTYFYNNFYKEFLYIGYSGTLFCKNEMIDSFTITNNNNENIIISNNNITLNNYINLLNSKLDFITNKQELFQFYGMYFKDIKDLQYVNIIKQFGRKKLASNICTKFLEIIQNEKRSDLDEVIVNTYNEYCEDLLQKLKYCITVDSKFMRELCGLFFTCFLNLQTTNTCFVTNNTNLINLNICKIYNNEYINDNENIIDNEENLISYKCQLLKERFIIETIFKFAKEEKELFLNEMLEFIATTPEIYGNVTMGYLFEVIVGLNLMLNNDSIKLKDLLNNGEHLLNNYLQTNNNLQEMNLMIDELGLVTDYYFENENEFFETILKVRKQLKEGKSLNEITMSNVIMNKLFRLSEMNHKDFILIQYNKELNDLIIVEFSFKFSIKKVTHLEVIKSFYQLRTDMCYMIEYNDKLGYQQSNHLHKSMKYLLKEMNSIPTFKLHVFYPYYELKKNQTLIELAKRSSSSFMSNNNNLYEYILTKINFKDILTSESRDQLQKLTIKKKKEN